jgi:spoIIIJ-associated protein
MIDQQVQEKIDTNTLELTEKTVVHLLGIIGFTDVSVSCSCKDAQDKRGEARQQLDISIKTEDDGRMLIGTKGSHLSALSHVVRVVLRRQLERPTYVVVDVNGYLATRERNLLNLAEEAARKVGRTGRSVVLAPMDASARHTVHAALTNRQDIKTESLGDEPNRRVVVKPIFI